MARKKKPPPSGPSNAYLMSFGDTMTTLLAFFIILNSLAQDQTGANMHAGTGSFVKALGAGGSPSSSTEKRKDSMVDMEHQKPKYVVPSDKKDSAEGNKGPDDENDKLRVIDREKEDFERFVRDLEKLAKIKDQPDVQGEAVFDYFDRLGKDDKLLTQEYRSAIAEIIPLLYQPNYRVEVVVWAKMPGVAAWGKAAKQAKQIVDEISSIGALKPRQRKRLRGSSKLWFEKDVKRPVITIITRKM